MPGTVLGTLVNLRLLSTPRPGPEETLPKIRGGKEEADNNAILLLDVIQKNQEMLVACEQRLRD